MLKKITWALTQQEWIFTEKQEKKCSPVIAYFILLQVYCEIYLVYSMGSSKGSGERLFLFYFLR